VLTIDYSGANPTPAGGVSFDGGGGVNTLAVIGTSGDDMLANGTSGASFTSSVLGLTIPLSLSNVQGLQMRGGSGGNDVIDIADGSFDVDGDTAVGIPNVSVVVEAGGIARFTGDQHLANLTINGASAEIVTASRQTVSVGGLSITAGGRLDLGNNNLSVDNTVTPFATLQSYWQAGYNNDANAGYGLWDGSSGITSSVATTSAQGDAKITIGYLDGAAQDDPNIGIYADNIGGPTLATNQVLFRPCLMGDLNLDGVVDGNDIGIIIGLGFYGKTSAPHGWLDGDLNGDGLVDGNDVGLIIGTGTYNNGSYGPAASPFAALPLAQIPARTMQRAGVGSNSMGDEAARRLRGGRRSSRDVVPAFSAAQPAGSNNIFGLRQIEEGAIHESRLPKLQFERRDILGSVLYAEPDHAK
jgi:hypothetical protein